MGCCVGMKEIDVKFIITDKTAGDEWIWEVSDSHGVVINSE
jgi:hypothetical protein